MRKILMLLVAFAIVWVSCEHHPKVPAVDFKAEETAVIVLLEAYHEAILAKDATLVLSFYTEDMLSCGTDPGEFWNKQALGDIYYQLLEDFPPDFIPLGDRVVKVAHDGQSAVAVEQYYVPMFTNRLPFRNTHHLVKVESEWKILVTSVAFIPKNEDIPVLVTALSQ